jgi:hypothetical protein
MGSTLSSPAGTPLLISAEPEIANAVPELFSGDSPGPIDPVCAFLPSGAESGLETHDQCERRLRPGIHTVDHGRTPAGSTPDARGVLNREPHVYVTRSRGRVASVGRM